MSIFILIAYQKDFRFNLGECLITVIPIYEEYEGTGIGLAIAQKIVHQQSGQSGQNPNLEKELLFISLYQLKAKFSYIFLCIFHSVLHRIFEMYLQVR